MFERRGRARFFRAVQLEFGFLLGPEDGRYLLRASPEDEPDHIVVLRTLGAPQRRMLDRRRRPRRVRGSDPVPVPTARAGVVAPVPFESEAEAGAWLGGLRGDRPRLEREVAEATQALNRLMQAHRAAARDPYARDLRSVGALIVRVGHGTGEQVADGLFTSAVEVHSASRRSRRLERLTPQERLAAIVGGRDRLLAADDLVLRARADLDAGRPREAALQARIALECVLEELEDEELGDLRAGLEGDRDPVSQAAAAALTAEPQGDLIARVEAAVGRMETALRRHRANPA